MVPAIGPELLHAARINAEEELLLTLYGGTLLYLI